MLASEITTTLVEQNAQTAEHDIPHKFVWGIPRECTLSRAVAGQIQLADNCRSKNTKYHKHKKTPKYAQLHAQHEISSRLTL